MTLRVNISIVPYGIEKDEYPIARIDIHNVEPIADHGFGHIWCRYRAELKTPLNNGKWDKVTSADIEHDRRDGAILLAEKACEAFKDSL